MRVFFLPRSDERGAGGGLLGADFALSSASAAHGAGVARIAGAEVGSTVVRATSSPTAVSADAITARLARGTGFAGTWMEAGVADSTSARLCCSLAPTDATWFGSSPCSERAPSGGTVTTPA